MTKWIVTAVDRGETCDGKARVLSICDTEDEAKAYVRNDIEDWIDQRAGEGVEANFEKMEAHYDYSQDDGCSWNIEQVQVGNDLPTLKEMMFDTIFFCFKWTLYIGCFLFSWTVLSNILDKVVK